MLLVVCGSLSVVRWLLFVGYGVLFVACWLAAFSLSRGLLAVACVLLVVGRWLLCVVACCCSYLVVADRRSRCLSFVVSCC